ncbi:Crp/Fnr family transcriptional regulator [Ferruginibacter paludis]|uniref:Crp/Fnr family transcriptional regulator n=1 Tax=Ferruginibacter paludis TaxID=1310417 RepID=UPI0025B4FFBF|nr:Crp/Fnr family transcriptional regulator [Ferruginibacter paludis]MDN3658602.1 Crp/Fnr family transcriptional regulator [Ferruginibacter paludis]
MDDFLEIKKYVAKYIQLTEEEESYFVSQLRIAKVKKKEFVVRPGYTCKFRSCVLRGSMRAYLVDSKGQSHTIAFAIEDWWISDMNSYLNQEPATLFVEALEDTTLIQFDYLSEQRLLETIPKFERFFRLISQRSFAFLQRRMLSNLSKTAEERYDEFMQKYSSIANRVPQYALASYLGFSTEFLSKIRNKKSK